MLTEKPARTADARTTPAGAPPAAVCYFEGAFTPLAEARVGVMTHAFMYGTACFEGVRAYWNADQGQLYLLKAAEHYRRLQASARVMLMDLPQPVDELVALTVELLRRNGFREDAYVRPSVYKSSQAIGVRLHDLEHRFMIVTVPFGDYIDTARGISAMTTSWRRTADVSIPARSKITGAYANSAFAKSDANLNGHDEAIVLTADGHASEGSAENLFIVRDGQLVTPPVTDDILEGVTRAGLITLARQELGLETIVRSIDRSELYVADEVFLCGTGAQVSGVASVDHRAVGDGAVGPITRRLMDLYFDAVRGRLAAYADWLTPVY